MHEPVLGDGVDGGCGPAIGDGVARLDKAKAVEVSEWVREKAAAQLRESMLAMEQATAVLQTKQQSDNLNIEDGGTVLGATLKVKSFEYTLPADSGRLLHAKSKATVASKSASRSNLLASNPSKAKTAPVALSSPPSVLWWRGGRVRMTRSAT